MAGRILLYSEENCNGFHEYHSKFTVFENTFDREFCNAFAEKGLSQFVCEQSSVADAF